MTPLKLPPNISEERAISVARQHKEIIWRNIRGGEDKRIDALVDVCTGMCLNDRASGKRLASLAIWSPGP